MNKLLFGELFANANLDEIAKLDKESIEQQRVRNANLCAAAAVARAEMRERIARYLEERAARQRVLGDPESNDALWAFESAAKAVREMGVL